MNKFYSTTLLAGLLCLANTTQAQPPTFSWVHGFGSTGADLGLRMVTDAAGNTYTTGSFTGTFDFNPGPGTANLTSAGGTDVYVLKLDAAGNYVWAVNFGGTDDDVAQSLTMDASSNIYLTGSFKMTADFDPSSGGTFNLSSNGGNDVFVCKLNSTAGFVWAVSTGSTVDDVGNAIALDPSGNVVIAGNLGNMGTADFDPGMGSAPLTSFGGTDDFIWKLDAAGNFVFVKQIGGTVSDLCNNVAIDGSGNIYLTGSFNGNSDFDPDAVGSFTLSSAGSNDIFICKLDNAGNFGWAVGMGSTTTDIGNYITLDNAGNVLVTGSFAGTVDFDPSMGGVFGMTASGLSDPFVCKFTPAGAFVWAKSFTGAGFDRGLGLTVDASNNIYTSGLVSNTTDFDPGAGTFSITGAGGNDGFVCQLDANGNFGWAFTVAGTGDDAVQSVKLSAGKVFVAGRFSNTADFDPDAVATANQTSAGLTDFFVASYQPACTPTDSTITATSCTNYTLNSTTYTTSGTYSQLLTNAAGCDSTINLNLTINQATDSIMTVTACNSYTLNGFTYGISGTTYQYLVNAAGCDSVIQLNLTINAANASVTSAGATITAVVSPATYQWVDCNNAFALISGETNQSFTATANGDYAVIVTESGCTDTSACTNVTGLGIDGITDHMGFSVYPNPSNDVLNIASPANSQVTITDINGKTFLKQNLVKGTNALNVSPLSPGVYLVKMAGNSQPVKWIKL